MAQEDGALQSYRVTFSTLLLKAPVASADVITLLPVNTKLNVVGVEGNYLHVRSVKGNTPGYVSRQHAIPDR
jgi:hypothetical protein